ADFRTVAEELAYAPPRLAVVSNLTGRLATEDELCSADYWVRQVRGAVRFGDGVRELWAQEAGHLVELGPDGTLCAMAEENRGADAAEAGVVPLAGGRVAEHS
ncbi:hypothetical protein, partial [Streptomyces oceani]